MLIDVNLGGSFSFIVNISNRRWHVEFEKILGTFFTVSIFLSTNMEDNIVWVIICGHMLLGT